MKVKTVQITKKTHEKLVRLVMAYSLETGERISYGEYLDRLLGKECANLSREFSVMGEK